MRFAITLITFALVNPVWGQNKAAKTLYERVGRYDAIATIADEYLKGVRGDPQFARFSGRGADSLKRARQLLKDQLCAMTGGPCAYIGRDMATAHGGLAITDSEWSASMKYMAVALDKANVTGSDRSEFLALIESLRPQIVKRPASQP